MGRERSREKEKDRDRRRDKENKEKDKEKEKDKDRKRSRSRRRRDKEDEKERDRSRGDRRAKKAKEASPEPGGPQASAASAPPAAAAAPAGAGYPPGGGMPGQRQRSPSLQYRRWRFDSPPKEEEYQRDAMLTGNPMGLGGIAAALQGGTPLAGVNPLQLAADTKASRELYVGNLPAGITTPQLVQFLNQVAQAVKVNSLPGEPILGATMGGGGLFAFVEFRTAEEAANGLRLNGVELLGCQLKVGRPKGYTGDNNPTAGTGLAALPSTGAPGLADMMAQAGALKPGQLALPGAPGSGGQVTAIDHRLCLINIPTFVTEDRIRELLVTFGQLKFFALQKDENGHSVGVAFFEYSDMMTQQQARAALEGLELGAKKLSVKKPDEVIALGLVSKVQKLGHRVVPSKVIYLKNIVTPEDLADETTYQETCVDIRLEAEKFGPVVSIEVPRGKAEDGKADDPNAEAPKAGSGGVMALTDGSTPASAAAKAAAAPAGAIVPVGGAKAPPVGPGALVPLNQAKSAAGGSTIYTSATQLPMDGSAGVGYAFIEFVNLEGSSKAKKGLNGRKFGENTVEAEFFSEEKYYRRDLGNPQPNLETAAAAAGVSKGAPAAAAGEAPGSALALYGAQDNKLETLEEAPVMVE
mmetsp:Transcript_56250/g.134039  ORF Transcript_56250/g.134039 Transcript_56250/m.134039 type:complete len:639 (+) Transcript_56250:85-2001(+)